MKNTISQRKQNNKAKKRKVNDQIVEFVYRIEIMNRRPLGLTTNPAYNFGLLLGHLENVGYPVAPDFVGLGYVLAPQIWIRLWLLLGHLQIFVSTVFYFILFFNITNDIFYINGEMVVLVSR